MAPSVHQHRRVHPHHPPAAPPLHPALPPDASIGHDDRVLELLQSYQDQIPAGVEGHGSKVVGYAIGPNPSENGDWISGEPRPPKDLCYFWTAPNADAPLSITGLDYIFERITEGKTTFND